MSRPLSNTRALRANMTDRGGWFGGPPPREKFHWGHVQYNIPGFEKGRGDTDPYWMDSALSGSLKYQKAPANTNFLSMGKNSWAGDKEKGIPPMPPMSPFGQPLIPRDEAAKFMPDIYIDGLADEIMGPLRKMAKHVVPHQFHQYYDESMVPERMETPLSCGTDMSRTVTWRSNYSMYVHRHPLADEMQRKMMIGDERAQQLHQDPDDAEYEADIITHLQRGDVDAACSLYKRMVEPPRNWHVFAMFIRCFAARGLLSDAVAVWDEMEALGVPPSGEVLDALCECAAAAEKPLRVAWVAGLARRRWPQPIPPDERRRVMMRALRYLCASSRGHLAATVWRALGADGLLDADCVAEEGAALARRAAALGLLPAEAPLAASPPHHHLYATTLQGAESSGAEPAAADADTDAAGSAAAAAAAHRAAAAAAAAQLPELSDPAVQHIDPKPMFRDNWAPAEVLSAVRLLAEHTAPAEAAGPNALPPARDFELPYLKKSRREHAVNPQVLEAFGYERCYDAWATLPHGGELNELPCQGKGARTMDGSWRRWAFRWHDAETRFVARSLGAKHPTNCKHSIWLDDVRMSVITESPAAQSKRHRGTSGIPDVGDDVTQVSF